MGGNLYFKGETDMENQKVRLVLAEESMAEQAAEFYKRNQEFWRPFEPERSGEYFTAGYQRGILGQEEEERRDGRTFRFFIKESGAPDRIIGSIGLSEVVRGCFQSCYLGYKMDREFCKKGYMTTAVSMITEYAFGGLALHRIEANVMPGNLASLRVLEKNGFIWEGLSRKYLKINGVWEDHVHMVKLNDAIE